MSKTTLVHAFLLAALALGACAIAGAPAPTPPPATTPVPLASPMPTAEAGSDIALADLTGWWTMNTTPWAVMHHDAQGRQYTYVDNSPHTFGLWAVDLLSIAQGVLSVHYRDVYITCAPDQIGRYSVTMVSPDVLQYVLVEDACTTRRGLLANAVLTRAPAMDAVIGAWEAGDQGRYRLAFRDDVRYSVMDVSGAEPAMVVEGFYLWDGQEKSFVVRDTTRSPCLGLAEAGHYRVSVDAGQTLTIELLDDPCEARRQALSEWGPYTRRPPESLAGCYAAQGSQRYSLCFMDAGNYRLVDAQDEALFLVPREGSYMAEGRRLRLTALGEPMVTGAASCRGDVGEYEFQALDETLRLSVESDPCDWRKLFFAANATWVRVDEQPSSEGR